jgi:hypothetical protein
MCESDGMRVSSEVTQQFGWSGVKSAMKHDQAKRFWGTGGAGFWGSHRGELLLKEGREIPGIDHVLQWLNVCAIHHDQSTHESKE